jgi:N-acetylglucosaminyl-diphospho-decaprenol L-rhamnosyltransferase
VSAGAPPITAVVVHYRDPLGAQRCIAACRDVPAVARVLVVDNSGDLPHVIGGDAGVEVVRPGTNLGFGRAANLALALVTTPMALVLNPDALPTADAVAALVTAADASGATVVGPALVDTGGLAAPAKASFSTPLTPPRPLRRGSGWSEVAWVAGAAMLLTEPARQRFDDRLFLYAEDEDLCWREWQAGRSVVRVDATMVHTGATATSQRWSPRSIVARTVVSQARVVRWHAGWRGVGRYLWSHR